MDDLKLNVAQRLVNMAAKIPNNIAIAEPINKRGKAVRNPYGKRTYRVITFKELDQDSNRIAFALRHQGLVPGMKLAIMVRQGIDFITLVFALYKAGAVLVLIDPGMGISKMLKCLRQIDLDGFVAISEVQAVRTLMSHWFPHAKINLTVGKRWFWRGLSLSQIRKQPFGEAVLTETRADDPAAIIFTSGSTGPAKGVLYTHRIFDTQVEEISRRYKIEPGEIDLAGFPFFGLFNAAMGTTAIIPDMDSTRPASVDPELFLEAVEDWKVTQSFGSPALWNRVVGYCCEKHRKMTTLKRAIIAGAPVPFSLLERFKECIAADGDIHTPYGATESLPVASNCASIILAETAQKTRSGSGICVGKRFDSIEWLILPITDSPISHLEDVQPLLPGEIGELAVTGPQVTKQYVTRLEANALAKMIDSSGRIWHRIGDVGYLDHLDRFWFCGRKAHRVETRQGTLFSIPCESIANEHSDVFRSALVGIPETLPKQSSQSNDDIVRQQDDSTPDSFSLNGQSESRSFLKPVIIVEPFADRFPKTKSDQNILTQNVLRLLQNSAITSSIENVLICPKFPVDVRHNAKINREKLAVWAAKQFSK
ncbi:MAG: fatty acid CoA ligase family protein [Planctomycetia bacterium]|nr:fatty acid CoA ligase family protein [Planctomycetia bacterium]